MCIKHFTSDDYNVSKDGKLFKLKPSAVPSVFDVNLIEVNEEEEEEKSAVEYVDVMNDDSELELMRSMNAKLNLEIEQLKRKHQSNKLITDARIEHINGSKMKLTNEVQSLKKQVEYLKSALDKARKTIETNFLAADIESNGQIRKKNCWDTSPLKMICVTILIMKEHQKNHT